MKNTMNLVDKARGNGTIISPATKATLSQIRGGDAAGSESLFDAAAELSSSDFSSTIHTLGVMLPALLAPIGTALGFMMYNENWTGSAFSLNLVKNCVVCVYFSATLLLLHLFAPTTMTTSLSCTSREALLTVLPHLALSAVVGVVLGDSAAIASLRRLGSRRYLLIDCLKPALATAIGIVLFGEKASIRIALGILAVAVGVYIASTANTPGPEEEVEGRAGGGNKNATEDVGLITGYALALAQLAFDTSGSSILKRHVIGYGVGPLVVGLVRFASAAIVLGMISLAARIIHTSAESSRKIKEHFTTKATMKPVELSSTPPSSSSKMAWWRPIPPGMTLRNWKFCIGGTFFVTFLAPALYLRSLGVLPYGIATALSCTAPMYEPFLSYFFLGTKFDPVAVSGAGLAFLGVSLLVART